MELSLSTLRSRIKELEIEVINLREQASRDSLTGCLRRESFQDLIKSRKQFGILPKSCSVMVLDIDHFKKVNDTYGHLVGDQVLREIGQLLREHTPESAIVSRFGGEEFVILCEDPKADSLKWAEKIRALIASTKIKINITQSVNVTVSIGHSSWDTDSHFDHAFESADQALYSAKKGGRNQVAA